MFAVFDGHGQQGDKVSRFLIGNMKSTFRDLYYNIFQMNNLDHPQTTDTITGKKMRAVEVSTQASSKQETELFYKLMTELSILLNYKLNSQDNFDTQLSGSTGIIVVCMRGQLITANIGDSRAVLVTQKPIKSMKTKKKSLQKRSNSVRKPNSYGRKGDLRKGSLSRKSGNGPVNKLVSEKKLVIGSYALSRDLLPSLDCERERILDNGGEVHPSIDSLTGQFIGPDRVWVAGEQYPGLMMSRSFGDQIAHACGVSEIPEIKIVTYNPAIHKGIILASDGVWEHVSNLQSCKMVEEYLAESQADIAVDEIVILALEMWKRTTPGYIDDTSCILAFFK